MKYTTLAAAALAGFAHAYPHLAEDGAPAGDIAKRQDPNPWILNPAGSVRSPCPGTNTLANHGFINRNGICITKQQYQQGFLSAFNMDFTVTNAGATNAINLCSSLTGRTCTCFNLDQLATPHSIEHDGSLSRRDKQYLNDRNANNQIFNQTIWDRSLQLYGSEPLPGVRRAKTAFIGRREQALRADAPGWFKPNDGGALTEHAFILSSMNDPKLGINLNTPGANPGARMDWINYWVVNMRLPTDLGWVRPTQVITGNNINSLVGAINAAPTIPPPRGTNPYQKTHPPPIVGAPNKRDITEWDEEPMAVAFKHRDVPTSILSSASVAASAAATPAPSPINAYSQVLSPGQWTSQRDQTRAHIADFEAKFDQAVADIQAGREPPAAFKA